MSKTLFRPPLGNCKQCFFGDPTNSNGNYMGIFCSELPFWLMPHKTPVTSAWEKWHPNTQLVECTEYLKRTPASIA